MKTLFLACKVVFLVLCLVFLSFSAVLVLRNTKRIETYVKNGFNHGKSIVSLVATLNNPVKITAIKNDFNATEIPRFGLSIPYKLTNEIGAEKKNVWVNRDEQIRVEVKNKNSGKIHAAIIHKDAAGKFSLAMADPNDHDRGTFTLTVAAKESFIYERDLTQDFTWGVVAVNTNKSVYTPGETAKLAFGVLNKYGSTICNAEIKITIGNPDHDEQKLSTKTGEIKHSPECGDNFSSLPDYFTEYKTDKEGRYFMHVTATTASGSHSITDYFDVKKEVPFSIERVDFPTRIYPPSGYPVELKITANEDYTGEVYDTVPKSFIVSDISDGGSAPFQNENVQEKKPADEIVTKDLSVYKDIPKLSRLLWQNPSTLKVNDSHKPMPIIWDVEWKKGETYTLSYTVNFPNVSPEYYLLGPFIVGGNPYALVDPTKDYSKAVTMDPDLLAHDKSVKFFEVRQWQIASDATKCWKGTVNANWSTANNWVTTAGANASITSNDVAVFDSSTTTCSSNSTANASTIDATFGGSVQGLRILTYANTITQARSLTLTAATGLVQSAASSVFSGATQDITTTLFNHTNGTFTSTSGTLLIDNNFTNSGGSFSDNGGTVKFMSANATRTLTGSTTFNNLIFDDQACNGCGADYSIANGTTFTVNGTLTLQDLGSGQGGCGITGTGGISAKGDITLAGSGNVYGKDGCSGDGVITVSGTGTQTLTGTADNHHFLPGLNINKSSGTLNVSNTVAVGNGGWTYTQGTLNMGTSLIIFKCDSNSTCAGISGSMTFYQVTFDELSCNGCQITYTLGSGTSLTVSNTLTFTNAGNTSGFCAVDGPGGISAQGDINLEGSSSGYLAGCYGTAVVTINGTGTQTLTGASNNNTMIPAVTIDKASGTLNLVSTIGVDQGWIYTRGTVSVGSSTIYMNNTSLSAVTITGSMTFNNLTFDEVVCNGCGTSYTISSGTVLTVSGTLKFDSANSGGAGGGPDIDGPGTIVAQGDITTANLGGGGTVAITLSGSASQTVTLNGTAFPSGTVTINKSSGTASLATNFSINSAGQDLILTSGTLDIAGHNLTVNDQFSIGASGTFKLQGGETISAPTSVASGSTVEYNGGGTYTTLPAGYSYSNLTISGAGTFTPPSSITTTGNYSQSAGTFNAPTAMSISGNFAKSGGSFVPGSGTVTFNDSSTTSTISGSTSFYNFTSVTPGKTINFTNGTTTTVTNALTLRGTAAALLTLASTTPTSQWNLTVNGSATLSLLSVRDSNACGGSNSPLVATGSVSVSNNSCWSITGYYTGWYDNLWTKRRTITVDHTKVGGDLTDFPMLIKLSSDANLATYALSNGNDILFTSEDGTTKLSHEIEKYNNSTGELEAWVKIPALSSTVNTTIYMYYGNAGASNQQDATNVWDSNYKGVWHLPDGTSLTAIDSTSNPNDGTATSVDATTGQIDGGALFNASGDKIDVGNNASLRITGDLTLSAWVKAINNPPGNDDGHIVSSSHTGVDRGYLIKSSHDLGPQNWAVQISGTGSDSIQRYSNTVRSLGTWYYVTGVYNASAQTLHIYVNGALDDNTLSGTVPASIHSSANNVQIGHDVNDSTMTFDGDIDEVHISSTSRSAAWTLTEYNNQSSPSTFFSISTIQGVRPLSNVRGGTRIIGGTKIHSN